jgi:hypothetical protein
MAEPADAKPERSQEGEASGASRTECRPSLDAGIPSRVTRRRHPEPRHSTPVSRAEPQNTQPSNHFRTTQSGEKLSGKHQDYLR